MSPTHSIVAGLVLALGLASCSPPSKVRVVERATIDPRIATERLGGTLIRIVQSGDTLHAIAFASGLDVNDIAAWNELDDTSRLRVGQKIRLTRPLNFKPKPPKKTAVTVSRNPPRTSRSTQPASENQTPIVSNVTWRWPTTGSVIHRFGSVSSPQGINIKNHAGQPVRAAAAGEVVYVGNGLKGYGNLVIIKHNDQYLSAYAHNRETFVSEGQKVFSQSSIGTIGLNKQQLSVLHFQIRRHGKPVNPLLYLPKR